MFVKGIRGATAPTETLGSLPVLSSRAIAMTRHVGVAGILAATTLLASSALVGPAHAVGLQINDNGACASWVLDGNTLTCNPAAPPVAGAPSGCTLTASPTSLPAGGGSVQLTAACSSGNATQYTWSGGAISGTTSSNVQQTNITSTTQFSVTPSNASGNGNAAQTSVTVNVAGGGGGGGGGAISCAGYATTTVLPLSYVPGSAQVVRQTDALSPGQILVVTFTTPAAIAGGYGQNGLAGVSHNYYASASAGFSATFSKTPCKTTYSSWANADGSSTKTGAPGQSVSWSFNTYKLAPNTTYYVNITGDSPLWVNLTAK